MFKIGDKLYDLHEVSKIYVTKTVDPQFPIKLRELADTLSPIKPNDIALCDKIKTISDDVTDIGLILMFTAWYLKTIELHKYIIKRCDDIITSLSNTVLNQHDLIVACVEINALIIDGYVFKTDIMDDIQELFILIKTNIDSKEKVKNYLNEMSAIIQKL